VWEHAYYLSYGPAKPEFVDNFLDYLINWKQVCNKTSSGSCKLHLSGALKGWHRQPFKAPAF
jgi:hypothetical protein